MYRFGHGAPLGFLQEAEPIPEENQIPEAPVNNGLHLSLAFEQIELRFLSVMPLCIQLYSSIFCLVSCLPPCVLKVLPHGPMDLSGVGTCQRTHSETFRRCEFVQSKQWSLDHWIWERKQPLIPFVACDAFEVTVMKVHQASQPSW